MGQGGRPIICDTVPRTIRGGTVEGGNQDEVNSKLRGELPSLRSKLFSILSQYQTFTQVTSSQLCGKAASFGNLEDVHNVIHLRFSPGHMTPPAVAAFDPIFWLHHANVDRHLALHQALYPNTYLEPCTSRSPTFTIEEGEVLNTESRKASYQFLDASH